MSKPRFIAGAVCPQCAAVDRTVLVVSDVERTRRCIACGYEVVMDASAQVPRGRLDGAPRTREVPAEAVRVLPPKFERDN